MGKRTYISTIPRLLNPSIRRKYEEKLDGKNKECHERKNPK
jgi:hypothetical protein